MNVRRCTLKNASGGTYTYLQLVHNYRDKATGKTKTNVLMKLGREDQIEPSYIQGIIKALSAILDESSSKNSSSFDFHASRELGGPWLLDALWNRLGMAKAVQGLLKDRQFETPVERLLFAMVAGRILAPGSKLSLEHWVLKKAYIGGCRFFWTQSQENIMNSAPHIPEEQYTPRQNVSSCYYNRARCS